MNITKLVTMTACLAAFLLLSSCDALFFGTAGKTKLIDQRDHDGISDDDELLGENDEVIDVDAADDDGDAVTEGDMAGDLDGGDSDMADMDGMDGDAADDDLPDAPDGSDLSGDPAADDDIVADEDMADTDTVEADIADDDVLADADTADADMADDDLVDTDTADVEVTDDTGIVTDGVLPDDDALLTDADGPECTGNAQCDDGVICTIDVCEFGSCRHLTDHSVCLGGKTCDPSVGCVSSDNRLCVACAVTAECAVPGDLCATVGPDTLCLVPCEYEGLCPADFTCQEVLDDLGQPMGKACVPSNGVCCLDLDGDNAGIGEQCGAYDCDEGDPDVHQGATEICDNRDNNCDKAIDELWPLRGTPCYDGVGQCLDSGSYICDPADNVGPVICTAHAADPGIEVCDDLDNDCDNEIDNSPLGLWDGKNEMCEVGVGYCYRKGLKICDAANPDGPTVCSVSPRAPEPEVCDGADNNCDTFIDNELPAHLCTLQAGVCAGSESVCMAELGWSICGATEYGLLYEPTEQSCDGLDNDCNGVEDDIAAGVRPLCANQQGVCVDSVKACDPDTAGWLDCVAADYGIDYEDGTETRCDNKDNDCDGAVDEIAFADRPYCANQQGVCLNSRTTCDDGMPKECGYAEFFDNNDQYQSTETKCDTLDNDCDGLTDNVLPASSEQCGNQTGLCAGAVKRCVTGSFIDCDGADYLLNNSDYEESSETRCDGSDNNCDGVNDNIADADRQSCDKTAGVCAGSKKNCTGGAWQTCTDQVYLNHDSGYQAGDETLCDALDNNCDGTVDNIADALRTLCENQSGVCAGSLRRCIAGEWQLACTAAEYEEHDVLYEEGEETLCDGFDNNCDGLIDNIADGYRPACGKSDGVCAGALKVCAGGGWQDCTDGDYLAHNAAYETGAFETLCDALDNNCDGVTDNLVAGERLPCGKQAGVCAGSMRRCIDGAWQTACTAAEYLEINAAYEEGDETRCDSLDNNCDTLADNVADAYRQPCGKQGGVCAGSLKVCQFGSWQPCTYTDYLNHSLLFDGDDELRCDNADNNCDGTVDNLASAERLDCGNQTGVCAGSKRRCMAGTWQTCTAAEYTENSTDYEAGNETKCDNFDNNCDSLTDNIANANRLPCVKNQGVCAGSKQLCQSGAWIACTEQDYQNWSPLYDGVSETRCDTKDNNCDGTVDNVVDSSRLPCSNQTGVCNGALKSCVGGYWQACSDTDYLSHAADYQAGSEIACDGKDNNCDGFIDTIPAANRPACAKTLGLCAGSKKICSGAAWQTCTASDYLNYNPGYDDGDELKCDNLDNNCDGTVDNIADGYRLPCAKQNGVCEDSLRRCTAGAWTVCTNADYLTHDTRYQTGDETVCDGADNNCDSLIDNIPYALRLNCPKQAGVCAGARKRCEAGAWADCIANDYVLGGAQGVYYQESETLCDSRDNDCDTATDEMVNKQTDLNNCGNCGVICYGANHRLPTCVTGSCGYGACEPGWSDRDVNPADCEYACATSNGGIEICDGLDNDCDNQIDEGLTAPNCANQSGVCNGAKKVCGGTSGWLACGASEYLSHSATYESGGETLCDGFDNDCDGTADETLAAFAPVCANQNGVCFGSRKVCGGGAGWSDCDAARYTAYSLNYQVTETTCDGLDNDCDASTDELLTAPNCANQNGVCAGAKQACGGVNGWLACGPSEYLSHNASFEQGSERTCDGLDNDCDGTPDETLSAFAPYCANQTGLCFGAKKACGGGAGWSDCGTAQYTANNAGYEAVETLCDSLDNNCNGTVDDPFTAQLYTVCSAGFGECQRSGIYVCNGTHDGVLCNATAGVPAEDPELTCDGRDNDCNSTVDDPYLRLGGVCDNTSGCEPGDADCCKNDVCYEGDGICRTAGIYVCAGAGVSCDAVASLPSETPNELTCDNIDNNCDGSTDEPWTRTGGVCANTDGCEPADATCCKNDICYAGEGLCRQAGFYVCDGLNGVGCNAVAGGGGIEICNYLDDDCDGTADQPFLTGGKYGDHTACGNCSTDCTVIYDKPNAYGECDAAGVPVCAMLCDTGYWDLNGIPDDGCEFLLDTTAIYVSESDGMAADDATCGLGPVVTGGHPCATITFAITRAQSETRGKLLVADGQYNETVTVVDGISLLGAYRSDTWERHIGSSMTIIRGNSTATHKKSVIVAGITKMTTIEGFIIYGQANYSAGGNSYALHISDSGQFLTVKNNTIYAGSGGPGADGTKGGDGLNGLNGNAGENTIETNEFTQAACDALAATPGNQGTAGDGGQRNCGGTAVDGGTGAGANCPVNNTVEPSGTAGNSGGAGGGSAGTGGAGGSDRYTTNCGSFTASGTATAMPGTAGGDGTNGAAAGGCASGGGVSGGEWVGPTATNGNSGTHGGGGGGGGAGGGGDVDENCTGTDDSLGGSGGGGGSGACAAGGGIGGGVGGGSFAIFITFTAATSEYPVVESNTLYGGSGGSGGKGGNGGVGGVGGSGGARGEVAGHWAFAMGQGGTGGKGGNGGHGGGGGGGCGGVSYGIYINNNATAPAYGTNAVTAGTGGSGGSGGLSLGNSGGTGTLGTAAGSNF